MRVAKWRMANRATRYSLFAIRFLPSSVFRLTQRGLDPRWMERQIADALAGGMGEGIGDGGDRRSLRAFARSERTLARTVDQLDLDLGRLRHGEDRIAGEVARQDAALVEAHLFLQRPAHRLQIGR